MSDCCPRSDEKVMAQKDASHGARVTPVQKSTVPIVSALMVFPACVPEGGEDRGARGAERNERRGGEKKGKGKKKSEAHVCAVCFGAALAEKGRQERRN